MFTVVCLCIERITIYHYKSNFMDRPFKGMPVVLNFTETNHFVRCCKDGERVSLQVQVNMRCTVLYS